MMELSALFPKLPPVKARQLSPLQLAYIGDSVHALLVRTYLIGVDLRVKDMHLCANKAVNAVSQAKALQNILPLLTEDELAIVKRGRNAHPHHNAPKSASTGEYAGATGLEALLGYLYLIGAMDRIESLAQYLYPEEITCHRNIYG